MRTSAVRPLHTTSPANATSIVYCLVPSRPLPAFDPKPTLKHALLTPFAITCYNNVIRRASFLMAPAYCIGFALRAASFFIAGDIGHIFLLLSVPLQIPLIVHVFLGLRSHFVRVLLGYFELWFQYVMLTVWLVVLGLSFDGMHIVIIPIMWLEFSNALLIETSQIMSHRLFVIGTSIIALFIFSLITGVSLDTIQDTNYHKLIVTPIYAVTTQDVLINSMTTLGMFFLRLVYIATHMKTKKRRHKKKSLSGHHEHQSMTGMRSVHFRCVLRWQDVAESEQTSVMIVAPRIQMLALGESDSNISTILSTGSSTDHLQLTPVENKTLFDSATTVFPHLAGSMLRMSSNYRNSTTARLLLVLGTFGVATNTVTLLQSYPPHLLVVAGFSSTLSYSVVMVACYQQQLLKQLTTSFNFIFLSVQISIALVCLCDGFSWEKTKVMSALAWWMWLHLVLTVDALTPVVKARLLFKVWYTLPVIALAIVGMVAWTIEHMWRGKWQLHDGVIWRVHVRESQDLAFYTSSLLLGRLVTLVVWFLRVIYRVGRRSSDDELVLLQGAAEFDYVRWKQRRSSALNSQVSFGLVSPTGATASGRG